MLDKTLQLDENVEITALEYGQLLTDQQMLHALQATGVDNWEGYEEAMALVDEWNDEL